jgi:hypothetical protein
MRKTGMLKNEKIVKPFAAIYFSISLNVLAVNLIPQKNRRSKDKLNQMLYDLSNRQRFHSVMTNSIIVKQSQSVIKSSPTPPVPIEAMAFSGTHQMSSDLLLHPVFGVSQTLAGVAYSKVVDSAS